MPVIPVVDIPPIQGRSPTPVPMGPTSVPRGANWAAAGQAFAGAAASLAENEEKRKADQRQANAVAVADAENRYTAELDSVLRNEKGYFAQQGEDALNTKPAHEKVEELRTKYLAEFDGNEHAQELFHVRSGTHAADVHKDIEEHSTRQRNLYTARVIDDTVERAMTTARKNYANVTRIENEFLDTASFIGPMLDVAGHSEDEIETKLKSLRAAMLNTAAQEYLTRPDHAAMGVAFLNKKLANGETVADAMGDLEEAQKTKMSLNAFAAQEAGTAIALQLAAQPKYRRFGEVDYNRVREDLEKSYLAEREGRKGPIVLGSVHVYEAALKTLNARETEAVQSRNIRDGMVLRTARSWFEKRGLPTIEQFETSKDPTAVALRASLTQAGLMSEIVKWRADWENAKNQGPVSSTHSLNMTRFLKNIGDNENAYTNMTADQFEGAVVRNLDPRHQDHARNIWFSILSQKGPVKARYSEGRKAVEGLLRAKEAIPMRSSGDVKVNDPSTWTPEEQATYQAAMLVYDEEFQNSIKDGEAPSLDDTLKIASLAGRSAKVPGRVYGSNVIPVAKALSEGREFTFDPPEQGSQEYNYYAGAVRAARAKAAQKMEAEGNKVGADELRNKPIQPGDIQRLFEQDVVDRFEKFKRVHPQFVNSENSSGPGYDDMGVPYGP